VTLTIELDREDDGRWTAEVMELGGLVTSGTRDDAIRAAKALALRVIADRLEHGEEILTGQPATDAGAPVDLTFSVAA
jgi:predicted RNase H-like HicB family nuclease